MRDVIRSAVTRAVWYGPVAVATLLASNVVLSHYGVSGFVEYQVVLAVGLLLLGVSDLGVGAALTTAFATAEDEPSREHRTRVLRTCLRTVVAVAILVEVLNAAVALGGWWPGFVDAAPDSDGHLWLTFAVFGLCIPLGLGRSVLLGCGRNALAVALASSYPIFVLGLIFVCASRDADQRWILVTPAVALAVTQGLIFLASGRVGRISWRHAAREVFSRDRFPGTRIRDYALAMFLISATAAVTLNADRVVLSHVSTGEEVARFALAMQIFAPALGLATASVSPLWPLYERARAAGSQGPSVAWVLAGFGGGIALVCAPLVVIAPAAGDLISDGLVPISLSLALACAAATVVHAATAAVAMTRMDRAGLRFIGVACALSVPPNVGLSMVLGHAWGAVGPMVANIVVVTLMQGIPILLLRVWRPAPLGRMAPPDSANAPLPRRHHVARDGRALRASADVGGDSRSRLKDVRLRDRPPGEAGGRHRAQRRR